MHNIVNMLFQNKPEYVIQKGLQKTFWGTTKKCDNKYLTYFLFQHKHHKEVWK